MKPPQTAQDRCLHTLFDTMTECWGDEPAEANGDEDFEVANCDGYGDPSEEPPEEMGENSADKELEAMEQQLQILRIL